jgi:aspartyl-tRNA(Asn)/glutamyl-tRNA(Gln) amidotransferase subunit B
LRADVNVSVRRPGEPLGTRCEIKNVNSIRFIGQAIEHEARRRSASSRTAARSSRRRACSIRAAARRARCAPRRRRTTTAIFPDPDLLPLEFDQAYVEALAEHLPELPDAKKARFIADYGLSPYDAGVLVAERESADFFETLAKGRDGKAAANWIINELFFRLNRENLDIAASPVGADQIGAIIDLISEARSRASSPRTCSTSSGPRAAIRATSSRAAG